MTAEEAISSSSGEFTRHLVGYLAADAAYTLVETGEYDFFCLRSEGYILKKRHAPLEETWQADTHQQRPGAL